MNWAIEEMQTLNLGDERLNQRLIKILDSLGNSPTESIPKACGGWQETKAAYRFFNNKKVTAEKVLEPHRQSTINRITTQQRVLLLQDTTELNYTGQQQKADVGPSHYDHEKVLFFHPLVAVTTDKLCLGIINIHHWHRQHLLRKKYSTNEQETMRLHHQHISEKESYRWLSGYKQANEISKQCPDTHIIMVADRESDIADIYDEAEYLEGKKADWIIRAKITYRALLTENNERDDLLLNEKIMQTRPIGKVQFNLPQRNGKSSRLVTQSVRTLRVKIHPPTGRRGKLRLRPFWVTAILAKEDKPPVGEKPIDWFLLTNIELSADIQFNDIINWYICRWQIEVFFYILKSGCTVEELQLTKADRFLPCLMLYSIIAWRILFLTHLSRNFPNEKCNCVLDKNEWQCAYSIINKKLPPKSPPTLSEAILLIAKLGGFLARKSDKEPGPKTIWRGLQRLHDCVTAIKINNGNYE